MDRFGKGWLCYGVRFPHLQFPSSSTHRLEFIFIWVSSTVSIHIQQDVCCQFNREVGKYSTGIFVLDTIAYQIIILQKTRPWLFISWGQVRYFWTAVYTMKTWAQIIFTDALMPRNKRLYLFLVSPFNAFINSSWITKLCFDFALCVFQLIGQKIRMCTQLYNCRSFMSVLEYLLAIGNYLNENAGKEKAKGFRLTSLAKVRPPSLPDLCLSCRSDSSHSLKHKTGFFCISFKFHHPLFWLLMLVWVWHFERCLTISIRQNGACCTVRPPMPRHAFIHFEVDVVVNTTLCSQLA